MVRNIVYPSGRLYCLTINDYIEQMENKTSLKIDYIIAPLKEENLFVQKIIVNSNHSFAMELPVVTQTLLSSFLPPNAILMTISNDKEKLILLKPLIHQLSSMNLGIILLYVHPKYGFGQERIINLWLRDKSPNTNLAVLIALQLSKNLKASINLSRTVSNKKEAIQAALQMELFKDKARLPVHTEIKITQGEFKRTIISQTADITIVGMPKSYKEVLELIEIIPNTAIFVSDSGLESALV